MKKNHYKVPMANRSEGLFLCNVVANNEDDAVFKAMEMNPTSSIAGRIIMC